MAAGVAAATLIWIGAWLNERRALANDEGRAAVFETRRGLNGELPRLPFPALVILMAITGFVEELLYRYAAIGLLSALIGCVLPGGIAAAIALVASSIAFWLSHGHYRNAGHAVLPWQQRRPPWPRTPCSPAAGWPSVRAMSWGTTWPTP